jgi:para-nitrobenzyl esterase
MNHRASRRLATLSAILPLLAVVPGGPATAAEPALATIASGRITGEAAGEISIFRGLPYAAPPVGPLRWRPPQPAASWGAVRPATAFGPSCPQQGPAGEVDITRYGGAPEPTSEDCLTLNVWAPAHPAKPAPVMVWFHGGSGRMGAGSLPYYDGASFARDGVVLITVNYRLGQLGAFAHPALTREAGKDGPLANYALMDQIAALKWVQHNAAAFGGDPGNVTIFGESSGGISVLSLTAAPAARGLFHKAIVESGGGWYPPGSLAAAEKAGEKAAVAAGAPANATVEQLRALPVRAIAAIPNAAGGPDKRMVREGLTISIDAGRVAPVPLMIGVNSGEDSLLDYGDGMAKAKAAAKPGVLAKVRELYGLDNDEAAIRAQLRDGLLTAPARWVAGKWRQPAYLYRFDYVDEGRRPTRRTAPHGGEIFYAFQTLDRKPDGGPPPTAADERMAQEVHARWVAFARTGSPNLAGASEWPAYSRKEDRWMIFNQNGVAAAEAHPLKKQLDWHERRTTPLIFLLRLKTEIARLFGR